MSDDEKVGVYTAGDIIVFTSGSYSSYGIVSAARALKDFTEADIVRLRAKASSPYHSIGRVEIQQLVDHGFVEEISTLRELQLDED